MNPNAILIESDMGSIKITILLDFHAFYVDFIRFLWILRRFFLVFMDSKSILLGFYGFEGDFTRFLLILRFFL